MLQSPCRCRLCRPAPVLPARFRCRQTHTADGDACHGDTGQVDEQCPVDHLAVFQLCGLEPCDAGFTMKDQTICLLLFTLGEHRIHQTSEGLFADGFELIIKGIHGVGLYGKLGGRSQENVLCIFVVVTDLCCDVNPIFAGHQYIQKQDIKSHASFDFSDQIQRTVKRVIVHLLFSVFVIKNRSCRNRHFRTIILC